MHPTCALSFVNRSVTLCSGEVKLNVGVEIEGEKEVRSEEEEGNIPLS